MTKMIINEALNGVELHFDGKPDEATRDAMKNVGFRWHTVKKMWYAKQNEKTLALAKLFSERVEGTASPAVKEIPMHLQNSKCYVSVETDWSSADGRDLTDLHNEPRFFTRNKRGMKKAWAEVVERFNDDTRMYDVVHILDKYNLRCHSWCGLD